MSIGCFIWLFACTPHTKQFPDLQTIAQFCESTPFKRTEFSIHYQIDESLPKNIEQSLNNLKANGAISHTKYLAYLMLRDYEYQLDQFASGFTLHPSIPAPLKFELERLLRQMNSFNDIAKDADPVCSAYAWSILDNPTLFADYPKGQALAARIRARYDTLMEERKTQFPPNPGN